MGCHFWCHIQLIALTSWKLRSIALVSICLRKVHVAWWRHQMETFSALLAIRAGNSPVPLNSPHKGQWRGALVFSLICVWINGWVNNRAAGDLRRHRGHYDVNVMVWLLYGSVHFMNVENHTSTVLYENSCLTTSGAASDENFIKMMTFSFQCHTWTNVDPVLRRHMASPGHGDLNEMRLGADDAMEADHNRLRLPY